MLNSRIVITGIGVISPAGNSLEELWQSVLHSRSPASLITKFDTSKLGTKIAAQVKNFDPTLYLEEKKASRYDPSILFSVGAASQAFRNSGLNLAGIDPTRIGVIEGSTGTGLEYVYNHSLSFNLKGPKSILPGKVLNCYTGGGSAEISITLGLKGISLTLSTACSSGNDALAYGINLIRSNEADYVLAGATDAPIVPPQFIAFLNAGVMSKTNDLLRPMRPFDKAHSGFVLGEGSCFFVLERLTTALKRKAHIYAEITGFGSSAEAYHITSSHPECTALKLALTNTLSMARLPAEIVRYINAHGSSTQTNELLETNAYKTFFGNHASKLQISGTKGVTGHMMGSVSAIESAICCLALQHNTLPPTAFLDNPIDGCDLDYLQDGPRPYPLKHALNVNLGFGGRASSVLFTKM